MLDTCGRERSCQVQIKNLLESQKECMSPSKKHKKGNKKQKKPKIFFEIIFVLQTYWKFYPNNRFQRCSQSYYSNMGSDSSNQILVNDREFYSYFQNIKANMLKTVRLHFDLLEYILTIHESSVYKSQERTFNVIKEIIMCKYQTIFNITKVDLNSSCKIKPASIIFNNFLCNSV